MLWTLLVLAAGAGGALARIDFLNNGNSKQNAPKGFMEQLRRQLMQNNYDYEPSSDEPRRLPGLLDEPRRLPGLLDEAPPEPRPAAWLDHNELDEPSTADTPPVPTFRNYPDDPEPPSEIKKNAGRRLSRLSALADVSRDGGGRRRGAAQRDLLYYVDDAWLHRNDDDDDDDDTGDNNALSSGDSDFSDGRRAFDTTPTTNTYKLLKLPGPARRDGQAPRFVEERSARGVALLSLDGAPFPPFRLPHERRQYQEEADLD